MRNLSKAVGVISKARSVVIASHMNPDGDSIGSMLALGLALERSGKRVCMLCQDNIPDNYRELPGARRVRKKSRGIPDLAIAVDCSSKEILGTAYNSFLLARKILEIDHHEYRRPFGDVELVERSAAAVGELVYVLLRKLKIKIDTDIAQNLLTSVVVETASFRLPNINPFTFKLCSELMKTGVDYYTLTDMIYWTKTFAALRLLCICLSRCKFLNKRKIVWSVIKRKDFKKVNGKSEDLDAAADEMRSIRGVEVAVLFRETDKNTLRVSLRSKNKLNVAKVAEKYNGAGHFDVAGCIIPRSRNVMQRLLDDAVDLFKTQKQRRICDQT